MKKTVIAFCCIITVLLLACKPHEHIWTEATCVKPKTCSECGQTEGNRLPHDFSEWVKVKEATCSEQGVEKRTCTRCGMEEERSIKKSPHELEMWVTIREATVEEDGIKAKICKICSQRYDQETIHLSGKEKKEWLEKNITSVSYRDLLRNPTKYIGKYVKLECYILQIVSEASSSKEDSAYRAATRGKYDDVVLLYIDDYGSSRTIEGDKLTVYGRFDGLVSYTTVLGAKVTVPKIISKYRIYR